MFVLKVLKSALFAILYIIGINYILIKMNFVIPFNLFSISIVSLLRFPGIILLIYFSRW